MTAISGCLDKDRFAAYTTLFSHLNPIYDILVENTQPSEEEINTFGVNVWAIKQPLLEILDAQLATPYMHVLCEHSHALLLRFKTLALYHNQVCTILGTRTLIPPPQAVEAKHTTNKTVFFRATPHHGGKGKDRSVRCGEMALNREGWPRVTNSAQKAKEFRRQRFFNATQKRRNLHCEAKRKTNVLPV